MKEDKDTRILKTLLILWFVGVFAYIGYNAFFRSPDTTAVDRILEEIKKNRLEDIEARQREIDSIKIYIQELNMKLDSNQSDITNITNIYKNEKSNIKHLPLDTIVGNLSKWVSKSPSDR